MFFGLPVRLCLLLCLAGAGSIPLSAATTVPDLNQFCRRLDGRLELLRTRGMDALKIVDDPRWAAGNSPHSQAWHNSKAQFGDPVPALLRDRVIRCLLLYSDADDRGGLSVGDAQDDLRKRIGYAEVASENSNGLFLVLVKNATDTSSRPELRDAMLVGRFGSYGLFAPPGVSAEVVNAAKTVIALSVSPKLTENLNLPGIDWQVTGTEILAGNSTPVAVSTTSPANANGVGPQLKGYDPKEANREPPRDPPPLKHIDYNSFITRLPSGQRIGSWLPSPLPPPEKPAKPRLTMADYVKQAERERAEIKARREKAAVASNNFQLRLIEDRRARQRRIDTAFAQRRQYVDGQAKRADAISLSEPVEEGEATPDGKEKWVVIYLHNRTDVTLSVTVSCWGGPPGNQYQRQYHILLANTGVPFRLTLFASGRGWKADDRQWKCEPVTGEYTVKVPLN